jgi:molybdenum cofactor cytidylyltransferase
MTQLQEALGVGRGGVVSFVGAGGKTTTAMRLADELSAAGQRVVLTTTTKIMEPIPREGEYLLISEDADKVLARIPELLARYPRVIIAHHRLEEDDTSIEEDASYPFPVRTNKVKGLAAETVDLMAQLLGGRAPVLVEADGAKHRSLKAPAAHEPVVPASTTLLVPMASLYVLGKPLSDEFVFRPERVASLSGTALGEPVTVDTVAVVLTHPQGGLKGLPPQARVVPLLNQWEGKGASAEARAVAELVLRHGRIQRVVVASLRRADPVLDVIEVEPQAAKAATTSTFWADSKRAKVAAIVLAAGASTRYGQPKQLLAVGGKTMLQHVVDVVLASPVDQTIVVLGHRASEMGATLEGTPADVVINEEWEAGLSTSVQAGLRAVRPDVQAALFVLADQPALTLEIIAALLERYRETGAPIVVPTYRGKRGNPALFDRSLFAELMEVRDDQGGRQIVGRYGDRTERVEAGSEAVLIDVDTEEDYHRFRVQDAK